MSLLRTVQAKRLWIFIWFLLLALIVVTVLYVQSANTSKNTLMRDLTSKSIQINEIIDRNLFERYGDVQAFGLNVVAHSPENWRNPVTSNPLILAMNSYTALYGVYKLMLYVDLEGNVLAVNSKDPTGKLLNTAPIYKQNFSKEPWFLKVQDHKFLNGRNSFTGSVVEQPQFSKTLVDVYGGDGFSIVFAAPVFNNNGQEIGVWANFLDFAVVDEIAKEYYDLLLREGYSSTEITLLNDTGKVIAQFNPITVPRSKYVRNTEIINKADLVAEGVSAAIAVVDRKQEGSDNNMILKRKGTNVPVIAGYSHSIGAYDYSGLDWSVLITIDENNVLSTTHGALYTTITNIFK